ncbi:isoprenylcysteine carboxylmethyltransferase family protein [Actinomyces viscosus]|uniref:methyltransferase family protein n=1 Tax=Actinomyces viscosus TaxID=1656 RepID=UPI0028E3124F|nr:isoprenylcysteine carboxylmethyltransferase family protein [Actinomyces viscosus]
MTMTFPRIPPLALFAVAGLAQRAVVRRRRVSPSSAAAAAPLLGASAWLLVGSASAFLRHRTTVDPVAVDRAEHLVVDGPNRLTRNPMYAGMAGVLLAHAVARRSPTAVIPAVGFVWLIDRHQIPAEEEALETAFGRAYRDYKDAVPRWPGLRYTSVGCLGRRPKACAASASQTPNGYLCTEIAYSGGRPRRTEVYERIEARGRMDLPPVVEQLHAEREARGAV